jgi:disulfide bond formation protein DsbB
MAGLQRLLDRRTAAALVAFAGAATVGAAFVFQHGFGYLPCKLCLQQRWPYYIAVPLALVVAFAPLPRFWGRVALSLVGLIFLAGAGLGVFHAGVEWGWWPGPNDCGGAPPIGAAS